MDNMDDAHINATLHSLYWRAGGRRTAGAATMLRRIVDDGSNLHRQRAFPAHFEEILLALLARECIALDAEYRQDLLELACETGYTRLASRLLTSDAALTAENGALCMAIAIQHAHVALLPTLLDAGVSVHGDDSATPVLSHAIAAGNSAAVEFLIASGARPDQQGHALAMAAIHNHTQVLRLCLAQGASQEALDDAFAMALAAQQPEAMATLLEAGASAEAALQQAQQGGDKEALGLIRATLFAQGRYDQLVSQGEMKAAALALQPAVILNKSA
ncbi:ankyrin repeat domain-containing protein|uniref:ankyrin repeat domain-containing protein n=1 Tax=Noviherbaspirillum sp. L7-7A TaxID=2850560 RepID=UPI001C2C6456|nr:ankyrin repeat domain-containing protein [Noviherbaspirillum sp. L7-7A]MBV0878580.1 ankyrin repeat domain-containing protein [Noviherbaspirillum sp. L7-7A]